MLEDLDIGRLKGPAVTSSPVDAMYCVLLLGERGRLGRERLAGSLGLGAGAVRTLISKLRTKKIVEVQRNGATLTKRGEKIYVELSSVLKFYGYVDCWDKNHENCYAAVMKKPSTVAKSICLRDEAVRGGADGALLLEWKKEDLYFLGEEVKCGEALQLPLRKVWKSAFEEGDVVIVAFGKNPKGSRNGALTVALSLITNGRKGPPRRRTPGGQGRSL
jgi:hypothetical protein